MNIASWLYATMNKLGEAGVDSPRRDALVLLEDSLGKDRSWILSHPEHELDVKGLSFHKLEENINRRIKREPLAYIRGKAWFYGRFFDVTPDVMIPRPESESFIELIKHITKDHVKGLSFHIVDVGTGSGCLAITAKLEIRVAQVTAVDLSEKALAVAKANAKKHHVSIQFIEGSLLEPLLASNIQHLPFIIMANLPYVPDGMVTSPEITHEPPEALYSGKDGLDHYRRFWAQVGELENKPKYILTESLENQHQLNKECAQNADYILDRTDVLVQLFIKR